MWGGEDPGWSDRMRRQCLLLSWCWECESSEVAGRDWAPAPPLTLPHLAPPATDNGWPGGGGRGSWETGGWRGLVWSGGHRSGACTGWGRSCRGCRWWCWGGRTSSWSDPRLVEMFPAHMGDKTWRSRSSSDQPHTGLKHEDNYTVQLSAVKSFAGKCIIIYSILLLHALNASAFKA